MEVVQKLALSPVPFIEGKIGSGKSKFRHSEYQRCSISQRLRGIAAVDRTPVYLCGAARGEDAKSPAIVVGPQLCVGCSEAVELMIL